MRVQHAYCPPPQPTYSGRTFAPESLLIAGAPAVPVKGGNDSLAQEAAPQIPLRRWDLSYLERCKGILTTEMFHSYILGRVSRVVRFPCGVTWAIF